MEDGLIQRYLLQKLKEPGTYIVAAVVGTFINIYGHILVPWLRGAADPVARFTAELNAHPTLVLFSIFIAYLFPVIVGVYSSVATRYQNRAIESRALFPDMKPDPVFRARVNGEIIDAGETTRAFLITHQINNAADLFGQKMWDELTQCHKDGKRIPPETRLSINEGAEVFLVAHSPAFEDALNIYLTRTTPLVS